MMSVEKLAEGIISSTINDDNDSETNLFKDIVSQIRSGKSHSDAFTELRTILANDGTNNDHNNSNMLQLDDSSISIQSKASHHSRISQEDRRRLIKHLLESKKATGTSRSNSSSINNNSNNNNNNSSAYSDKSYANGHEEMNDKNKSRNACIRNANSNSSNIYYNSNINGSRSFNDKNTQNTSNSSRNNDYNQSQNSIKTDRIAREEEVIRQQMFKDFTFQPRITEIPKSLYGPLRNRDTPFHQRVTKWQKDVEEEVKKRRQDIDNRRNTSCTFHPQINRNSEKAVKEMRAGIDDKENIVDRLHNSADTLYIQRSTLLMEEENRRRKIEERECTFTPNLSATKRSKYFSATKPRYSAEPKILKTIDLNASTSSECTFTPKVKGIGSYMSSAKAYIKANVVDRLSRSSSNSNIPTGDESTYDIGSRSVDLSTMDVNSYMGAYRGNNGSFMNSSFSAPGGVRPQSAPCGRGRSQSMTADEVQQRKKNFQNFLGRQSQTVLQKERKLNELQRSLTPSFRPTYCDKSYDIMRSIPTGRGGFLDRVDRDKAKREDKYTHITVMVDQQNTFTPTINSRSAKLRGRSIHEFSRGDVIKSENNKRMMRVRLEQDEMKHHTFQPKLSKKSKALMSTNKHRPKIYEKSIELHSSIIEKNQRLCDAAVEAKEKEVLQQCTFQPKTTRCPSYVQRIAKSMAYVRANRKKEEERAEKENGVKPGWK